MKDQIEKQAIEEMAKVIERTEQIARDAHCGLPSPTMYAKDLYWHGYRKQEWISVDERLPESSDMECLLFLDTQMIAIGWYHVSAQVFVEGGIAVINKVTHWMPLPEPPKMKGGEKG